MFSSALQRPLRAPGRDHGRPGGDRPLRARAPIVLLRILQGPGDQVLVQ